MADNVRITGNSGSVYNGINVSTPYEQDGGMGVEVQDFLNLMVAQLSNQDFMNPVDDTQYVTQLAQFATMQSMQELSHYSQTSYVTGLIGKTVTVASLGLGGSVSKDVGVVSGVNLSGEKYTLTVNGKQYDLSQIMVISDSASLVNKNDIETANKMTPIVHSSGEDNISLRWDSPVTDSDQSSTLRYDVYYAEADSGLDFTTLTGVKGGTKAADNVSSGEFVITNLEPGTSYNVNVVVRNQNGDEAVYQYTTVTTSGS